MRIPAGALFIGAFCLLGAAVIARGRSSVAPGTPRLDATPMSAYALEATGTFGTRSGVDLTLRSTDTTARTGSATVHVAADTLRGQRVRISGVLATDAAREDDVRLRLLLDRNQRPWIGWDIDADTGTLRAVELIVPDSVTAITVDVILAGRGTVTVRNLTLAALGRADPHAPLGDEARRDLDSALAAVRAGALHRRSLPWASIEAEVRALAAGARSAAAVAPALHVLVNSLGDGHSYYMSPGMIRHYREGARAHEAPTAELRDGGVGVVRVPAHLSADSVAMRRYATALHAALRAVAPRARCGWIVDLRDDRGGNLGPMLAGLQPLLGADTAGMFLVPADARGTWKRFDVAYTAIDMLRDMNLDTPTDLEALARAPVAVLTGPMTASAGEAVAIAFRGRARTRSFGARTAGVATGIHEVRLPSGAALGLAGSVMADRRGQVYQSAVEPDEKVRSTTNGDATIERASAWLRREASCR